MTFLAIGAVLSVVFQTIRPTFTVPKVPKSKVAFYHLGKVLGPTKALISAQRITMTVAPCERSTKGQPRAADACSDAGPPCELQTRRRPTQLIPREAMPRVSHERGLFPSVHLYLLPSHQSINRVVAREREKEGIEQT